MIIIIISLIIHTYIEILERFINLWIDRSENDSSGFLVSMSLSAARAVMTQSSRSVKKLDGPVNGRDDGQLVCLLKDGLLNGCTLR